MYIKVPFHYKNRVANYRWKSEDQDAFHHQIRPFNLIYYFRLLTVHHNVINSMHAWCLMIRLKSLQASAKEWRTFCIIFNIFFFLFHCSYHISIILWQSEVKTFNESRLQILCIWKKKCVQK